MNQPEIRMFALWTPAATLPESEIEAMTFEECLAKALEIGVTRFDRKTLAKKSKIHYPHLGDLIAGRRPFPATKLHLFCMFSGCDYPRQWLAIQERKAIEEYRRLSQQAIGEFVQQAFAQRQAAA
ncbi:hypothetical protein ACTJLD_01140 [Burkholderia sp. 22088]|uniref:hypothetical protein n=1 Tax=Burkholderia sp. 22088 TaxID=3453871 RepID=UPI003F83B1AC